MSSISKLNFTGMMVAVFTPFNDDERQTVNLEMIDNLAKYVKHNLYLNGVLVNGTTGEGVSLSIEERKIQTEKWIDARNKYGLKIVTQIGGTAITNVIDLAIHAESIGVDGVLCLPELYFKPKTEETLVEYVKTIAKYCPKTPFIYYHNPNRSNVHLNMPRFIKLAQQEVPNFAGLKLVSTDIEECAKCFETGTEVYLGSPSILFDSLNLGINSSMTTELNLFAKESLEIENLFRANRTEEAISAQGRLNALVDEILTKREMDSVAAIKQEFNNIVKSVGIYVGSTRIPF